MSTNAQECSLGPKSKLCWSGTKLGVISLQVLIFPGTHSIEIVGGYEEPSASTRNIA